MEPATQKPTDNPALESVIYCMFSQWKISRPHLELEEELSAHNTGFFNKFPVYFRLNFKQTRARNIAAVESVLLNQDILVLPTVYGKSSTNIWDYEWAMKQHEDRLPKQDYLESSVCPC